MEQITTASLDIAKQVFQFHGIDAAGAIVVRRKLRRDDVLGFFKDVAAVPGRHRGLRHRASLGAYSDGAPPHDAPSYVKPA